jgi:DNA polymerase-3 subunit beta
MRINFNRQALAEALNLLTSIVPSRTPKPILRCVRVKASKDEVRIYATDLEVGLCCLISEAQIEEPGDIVVQADRLSAIVRESDEDVLAVRAAEGTCEIIGTDSHFTIYGQDVKQYPAVPDFQGEPEVELGLQKLQEGIVQCLFATAKESSRYAINGVLWQIKGKKMSLVATDGRRLAQRRVALLTSPERVEGRTNIIVPAKAMVLLEKITADDKEKVAIKFIDNQVIIKCANIVLASNLVEGNFPKYEDIIPKDYDKRLKLSTEGVLSAVRRAALLTSQESKGIKLSIIQGTLIFTGRAPETGAAEVKMPVEYDGENIDIGFNPQFLIDVLRVIHTPDFDMELGQPDRPGLIKSGADFLYVLMPISLG